MHSKENFEKKVNEYLGCELLTTSAFSLALESIVLFSSKSKEGLVDDLFSSSDFLKTFAIEELFNIGENLCSTILIGVNVSISIFVPILITLLCLSSISVEHEMFCLVISMG